MTKVWGWMRVAAVVFLVAGGVARVGVAQYSGQTQQQMSLPGQQQHPKPGDIGDTDGPPELKARQEELQKRAINEDRHKKLVADTEKLVVLANELKAEVAKSQKDELNIVVVRKAGEMEKLAHDVRVRMTY